jgi:RNA polymerase sigma factor (sigma-70 family)
MSAFGPHVVSQQSDDGDDARSAGAERDGPVEAAYRAARPRLVQLAVLLVDDRGTAEDVVQDVFARLQRRGYPQVDSIDAYLTAAVLNAARSSLRRRGVAARGLLQLGSRARLQPEPDLAELSAEQARVWQAITRLPTRQRQVVVCRYYLDLSERETARSLGVSAGTVKTCAARALKALSTTLGDQHE